MSSLDFYKDLPSFRDFSKITDPKAFVDVPQDWCIVLTDVRGSTRAIQEGRYKQVNIVGAASITCILNSLGAYEFPFVFGGDGATILIPNRFRDQVCEQLKGLQAFSWHEFSIELRVGVVELERLYSENCRLQIGKYELSSGNFLAQFRGTALTRAEEMVKKSEDGATILSANPGQAPNLEGLSCRLNPLKSQKGLILSLLCKPASSADSNVILQKVVDSLKEILKGDFNSASPVQSSSLKWGWIPKTFWEEIRVQKGDKGFLLSFFKTLVWTLLSNASLKFSFRLGPFRPEKYKKELVINSDFKKFDETLRMVIDCDVGQAEAIEKFLAEQYKAGQLFYGVHRSSEALMTCMVFSASQNQHIHFIDGSSGGYAMAAIGLKKQMK
ncbi:MAG: DUF3095 domain-containing protein [Pseudobdellovibrionaceae bacterium]